MMLQLKQNRTRGACTSQSSNLQMEEQWEERIRHLGQVLQLHASFIESSVKNLTKHNSQHQTQLQAITEQNRTEQHNIT